MLKHKIIKKRKRIKLQMLIVILVFSIVFISVLITNFFIDRYVSDQVELRLSEKIQNVARVAASSEPVVEGLQNQDASKVQVYAQDLMETTDVDFVVILNMDLIRLSHPIESEVGQSFFNREDAKASLEGMEYFSVAEGPLGLGMRVFTPVKDAEGKQIGVVVTGVSTDTLKQQITEGRQVVYSSAVFQVIFALFGAFIVSSIIKKQLLGLEPTEIARLLKEREAVMQSVKEGIMAVNSDEKVSWVNKEALRLMQLDDTHDLIGKPVKDLMPIFSEVIHTGKPEMNHEEVFSGQPVLVNCKPIIVNEKIVGGIGTFRDKTELKQLAEQLTGIKLYSESLRAHTHEFMNKLHVIFGLIHMKKYDALTAFIDEMVEAYEMELGFVAQRIKNPVFAGFLLGKMSKARELDIQFNIDEESWLTDELEPMFIHDLIRIAGNLIENAFDAVNENENKEVGFSIYPLENQLIMEVQDNGIGIEKDVQDKLFNKGYSTKGEERGYGLYLTKKSIENLQGELMIDSEVGTGTTFIVTFPITSKEENS